MKNLSTSNLKESDNDSMRSTPKHSILLPSNFHHFLSEKNLRKRNTKNLKLNLKLENNTILSNKKINSRKSSFYMPEKNKTQFE